MNLDLKIREAVREDIPSILSLYSEIEVKGAETLAVKEAEEIFAIIDTYPNYHIYLALNEENPIGTFALLIMDNLGHKGKKSGVLEDVAVSAEWQGKGVGRKMMDYAMQVCKDAGCYKLTLSSNMAREGAHKFYESLGYKKHGFSYLMEIL